MIVLFLLGPLHHDVHEELDLVLKTVLPWPGAGAGKPCRSPSFNVTGIVNIKILVL